VLDRGPEQPLVRLDGLVEVLNRDAEVMNAERFHALRMLVRTPAPAEPVRERR
jgi:hypothetical protein